MTISSTTLDPAPSALAPASDARRSDAWPILIAVVAFSGMSIWGSVTSEGFLEADSCTHYLYARFAFTEPHYLVNVWGRPLCTGLYALRRCSRGAREFGRRAWRWLCAAVFSRMRSRGGSGFVGRLSR